jgi:hypothetical protein
MVRYGCSCRLIIAGCCRDEGTVDPQIFHFLRLVLWALPCPAASEAGASNRFHPGDGHSLLVNAVELTYLLTSVSSTANSSSYFWTVRATSGVEPTLPAPPSGRTDSVGLSFPDRAPMRESILLRVIIIGVVASSHERETKLIFSPRMPVVQICGALLSPFAEEPDAAA